MSLNEAFNELCKGLKKSDVSFAKNLFKELNLIEPNMLSHHRFLISLWIANDNKNELSEKELAQMIIKIYKENYKRILQQLKHKSIPEVAALYKIVELAMKNKQLYEDCVIKVISRI